MKKTERERPEPQTPEQPAVEHHAIQSGSGACSKCNCKTYEGSAYTCANQGCGHAWQDHW